jgi:hypothetical protein
MERSHSMRMPRFSISTLLVVIAILGVAMAALRSPSYLWANVTFTIALLAILTAVASAIVARGAHRAYWLGFSLFGGTYLAICAGPGLNEAVCPRLATETLLDFVYPLIAPKEPAPSTPVAVTLATLPVLPAPVTAPPPPAPAPGALPQLSTVPIPPPAPVAAPFPGATPQPPVAPAAFMYYSYVGTSVMPTQPASRWLAWTRPDRTNGVGALVGAVPLVSPDAFRRIGHSLFALLLAVLGAAFAKNRYDAHRAHETPPRSDRDLGPEA